MKLYTLNWSRYRTRRNVLTVNVKVMDANGKVFILRKTYREWFGVLTDDIRKIRKKINGTFKTSTHERLNDRRYRRMATALCDRLELPAEGGKFFYKIYTDPANVYDVGGFFEKEDFVAYHSRDSWLTRIYIDFSNKFGSEQFYYNWYEIDIDNSDLLTSFERMYPEETTLPPMVVAAFDLETVPWEVGSNRFPKGFHPDDVIVMISLVMGTVTRTGEVEPFSEQLFYLDPSPAGVRFGPPYQSFDSEAQLIAAFLEAIDRPNVMILTGYNVVGFDLPCVFARINFLQQKNVALRPYRDKFTSFDVGKHTVVTFRKKMVLDMYNYFEFSKGQFDSLKLDDVARQRLGERKVPIHATAIHRWYQARDRLTTELLLCRDAEEARAAVDPAFSASFGTFETCLEYCLRDSQIVLRLIVKENAISFLIARSNLTTLSAEEVLYLGKSKYIENVFETYGTFLGYFVQVNKLRNVDRDGPHKFMDYAKAPGKNQKYQGALNHGIENSFHRDVVCYDFESLYPSCIMAFNVSYETFAVVHASTWDRLPEDVRRRCRSFPFVVHDFVAEPAISPDGLVMVHLNDGTEGFLPAVLKSLLDKRRVSKRLAGEDEKNRVFHHNNQLSYKLVMNSTYGCLGATDIPIACLGLAMSVTCFGRMLLLASYRYLTERGYTVPYCDTDSLFVVRPEGDLAERINAHLDFKPHVNLQFEARYRHFLVLTKKKYCYEGPDGIATKGFEKKSNELTKFMVRTTLERSFEALERGDGRDPSAGWCLLVELLQHAFHQSRNRRNYTTRNVRALEDYSERSTAPQVRLMRREEFFSATKSIQFTYVFTDVSVKEDRNHNPVFAENVDRDINFEQLFASQKKNILTLLNLAFFGYDDERALRRDYDRLIQLMRWKQMVNAAIACRRRFGEDALVLFSKGVKFTVNVVPAKRKK